MNQRLQQLFLRYCQELQQFLEQRVSYPETAEDLAQEAFLRVIHHTPDDSETANRDIRARLFRVAADLAASHQSEDLKRRFALSGMAEATGSSPEQQVLSSEEIDVLRQAIDELPRLTRGIFLMHKFDQLSYREIATRLEIPKNKVTVHMARALSYFRHRLDEHRRS